MQVLLYKSGRAEFKGDPGDPVPRPPAKPLIFYFSQMKNAYETTT